MIYMPIVKNITKIMDGEIRTGRMITEAGTAGQKEETKRSEVLNLRWRMIRNACAVLMCSRGTPCFCRG